MLHPELRVARRSRESGRNERQGCLLLCLSVKEQNMPVPARCQQSGLRCPLGQLLAADWEEPKRGASPVRSSLLDTSDSRAKGASTPLTCAILSRARVLSLPGHTAEGRGGADAFP